MKNIRPLFLLMLILTLTLILVSCNRIEETLDDRLDNFEDRIENEYRASAPLGRAQTDRIAREDVLAQSGDTFLSRESVESIVLEHVGITAADAQYLRTEFEVDDGIPVYDVNFYVNHTEYEYSIHAETGVILEFDRDR